MNHKKRPVAFICLLDKMYPPDHSFVTGMLAKALPEEEGVRVLLVCGSNTSTRTPPRRYHRAVTCPALPAIPRRGVTRLYCLAKAIVISLVLMRKMEARHVKTVLFVRNDPVLFMAAAIVRRRARGLIFQSSFPLESAHRLAVKRFLHKLCYKLCVRSTTGLLAVSPGGLRRISKLSDGVRHGAYIPLLADLPQYPVEGKNRKDIEHVRFVYVGTHDERRRLDVVLAAAVEALKHGAKAEFMFVGGDLAQIEKLRAGERVRYWERSGGIKFVGRVARPSIPKMLAASDVGLSLVPESAVNREMSPTKLAEYMGAGLAVLASRGVELQECFVERSGSGRLVEFEVTAIAEGMLELVSDREVLRKMKERSSDFAERELSYRRYTGEIMRLAAVK